MSPSDYCKTCGGLMKCIGKNLQIVDPCPVCKDSFGWDPVKWEEERGRISARLPVAGQKEDKPA